MKLVVTLLSLVLGMSLFAEAQTVDEAKLSVGGFVLSANGAESSAGVWRGIDLAVGKPTVAVFSMHGCGYFTVTIPPNPFEENATAGWRVEVTPMRVINHAVTFRLRWIRAVDKGGALTPASEDVEVTLRPGESRPLDSVPVAQTVAKTYDGRPCQTKAASLRLTSDFSDLDRRLISVDAWLVERLPNGKEESQLQSLRGLPHHAIPFYFDSVPDGTKRLDIFGNFVTDLHKGSMEIALETIRAQADPGQDGYQSVRWFRSKVQLKPGEIVEVALPKPDEKASAFANRVFSIRIRARQIR